MTEPMFGPIPLCSCHSGLLSHWMYDGYGIELFRACDLCITDRLEECRFDILEQYDANEPIEPED